MLPTLKHTPRTSPCRATIIYDPESRALCASFDIDDPVAAPTLADVIEHNIGISSPQTRLILGDIDILYTAAGRLFSIDIQTSPSRWRQSTLSVPAAAPPVWFTPVVEPDDNNICSHPAEFFALHAPHSLAFATSWPPARWVQLADHVHLGLDTEEHIIVFLFTNCTGL